MKAIILSILLLIFGLKLKAQNIDQLDVKRGFKHFRLGDDFSLHKPELVILNTSGKVNLYKYTGASCKTAFEYPVENVWLGFHQQKLVYIAIRLVPHNDVRSVNGIIEFNYPFEEYNNLVGSFANLFDQPTDHLMPGGKDDMFEKHVWVGKTTLLFSHYSFYGNYDQSTITLYDKEYYMKELSDQF